MSTQTAETAEELQARVELLQRENTLRKENLNLALDIAARRARQRQAHTAFAAAPAAHSAAIS